MGNETVMDKYKFILVFYKMQRFESLLYDFVLYSIAFAGMKKKVGKKESSWVYKLNGLWFETHFFSEVASFHIFTTFIKIKIEYQSFF